MNSTPRQRLDQFAVELRGGRIDAAFAILDALIEEYPNQAPLYWQRARALRAIGRLDEALMAVQSVIDRKNDFAPAFMLRAELQNGGASAENDLRRAIALDPKLAQASVLYARLLIGKERLTEAEQAIATALNRHPDCAPLYVERAHVHAARAALGFGDQIAAGDDIIALTSGHRVSRTALQAAAADFRHALALNDLPAVRIELARVLHQLGEFEAAREELCTAELALPQGDPMRAKVAEMLADADDDGRGEQARLAAQFAALTTDRAVPIAPPATRTMTISELHARLAPTSGIGVSAREMALDLYRLAYPAPLALKPTEPGRFPQFMREYAQSTAATLTAHGFRHLIDVEAVSLRELLSQPTLLRYFVSADGITVASSYRTEARRPSFWRYWLLRLRKKWLRPAVVCLGTQFDNGGTLITMNADGTDAFSYRWAADVLKLPSQSSAPFLVAKHRERIERYRREHPNATAQRVDNFDKIVVLEQRLADQNAAHRRRIGWVDDVELRQMLGQRYEQLRPVVLTELQAMKRIVNAS